MNCNTTHYRANSSSVPGDPTEYSQPLENELLLFLAFGVTTVRDMAGNASILGLSAKINRRELLGPHIEPVSPIIDGVPPSSPVSAAYLMTQVTDASRVVDRLYELGYRSIKVYNMLSAPVYAAIVQAAHTKGMTAVGHVPFAVGLNGALAEHQDTIEHLRGYDNDPSAPPATSFSAERFRVITRLPDALMRDRALRTAAAEIYNVPTLVESEEGSLEGARRSDLEALDAKDPLADDLRRAVREDIFPPEVSAAILSATGARNRQVRYLLEAGAQILPGTDSPLNHMAPGRSLHRELVHLVEAGMTPYRALRSATVDSQAYLGESSRRGTIELGKDADLVLLDSNPLSDIENVDKVSGISVSGTWLSSAAIAQKLKKSLIHSKAEEGRRAATATATPGVVADSTGGSR